MRKLYILAICLFTLVSCEKYTDILPKGKNLLKTTDELNYLLNYNFVTSNAFYFQNLSILINDSYIPTASNIDILNGAKNMNYTILSYDESVKRADIWTIDPSYQEAYAVINGRLNVILDRVSEADGAQEAKDRLKAEALTLRAYMHYLMVNIYAKSYDPATANTDGGIPYMDALNFETTPIKSTVAQVYEKITADIDAALQLNALTNLPAGQSRVSLAFLYSVKAQVLLTMRDFEGAVKAADQALALNNNLEDYRPFIASLKATRSNQTAIDNLFLAANKVNNPTFFIATIELMRDYFEPGYIIKDYTTNYAMVQAGVNYSVTLGEQYSGVKGALMYYNNDYQQNSSGMTVSDLYFIKAEGLIRSNKLAEGLEVLNAVKLRRYHPSQYIPYTAANQSEAMTHLKKLSRLEFLYTWKNFVNIKRWNTVPELRENNITRTMNGKTYTLSYNSPLWIFPFPQSVTNYNTNITQNY